MMKIKTALMFLVSAASAFAIRTAEIRTTKLDKTEEVKTVQLNEVEKDVWRLRIPVNEISRDTKSIVVVNDWAKAAKGEDGFFLTPNGGYGTFRIDDGKEVETHPHLRMFAMKNPRGAFLAIVKGLKFEYTLIAEAKKGKYEIYPRFNIDKIDFDPYEDIVIDFYKLDSDKANYSAIAGIYRDFLIKDSKLVPLAERVKGNPTLQNTANTMYARIKFARCDRRKAPPSAWKKAGYKPEMIVDHTFDDAKRIMKNFKDLGMDDIEVCFVGWHKGGHDGPFPDLFPVPEEIGGEAKMREAVAYGKSLGYRMTVHTNHHNYYSNAARFDEKNVNKNKDGTWRVYTYWPGGKAYHSCFLTVLNRYLNEDIARLKDIGINGTYHVDVTSIRIPSPCCNPLHPLTRQAMVDVENKIGRKLRENFGGFSSEGKFDHIAPTLDYGLYVRWDSLAKNTIIDKDVPLNELVLNGIILSNPYYGTIDAPYERKAGENLSDVNKPYCVMGTARRARLKVIEYGGRPSFYYIDYSDLAPMKWIYDDWQKLKYLQFRFFVFHDEIAPDVFLSRWDNGDEIISNYTDKPFVYKGETVKPVDYRLFKSRSAAVKPLAQSNEGAKASLFGADNADAKPPRTVRRVKIGK